MTVPNQDDTQLAEKIIDAIKEYDAADATRKDKAIAVGKLLAEAQQRHPSKEAFEKFLQLAGGIQYRRAVDLIGIALNRKDFEQHQAENVAAQQRHRDKLKAEKIEKEKAKAALPKPEPKSKGKGKPEPKPAEPKPSALRNAPGKLEPASALRNASAASLREFENACEKYLPQLNEADLKKASVYFNKGAWKPKTNRKAA